MAWGCKHHIRAFQVQQDKTDGVKHQGGGAITEIFKVGVKERRRKIGLACTKIVSRRGTGFPLWLAAAAGTSQRQSHGNLKQHIDSYDK